jgi:hypothetical protein
MTETVIEKITKATKAPEGPRRLCKDCRHCRRALAGFLPPFGVDGTYDFAMCQRPTGKSSLISGRPQRANQYCSVERGPYEILDVCGRLGRYWEAK